VPATASATVSTFDRLEVIGTADFRNLTEVCDDGSTVTSRVRITCGHEEEAEDGVTTLDRDYLRVQIQSGCTGIIQVTTNDADFTWSPSLQTASVVGTFTTTTGQTISVDIAWEDWPDRDRPEQHVVPGQVRHVPRPGARRGGDRDGRAQRQDARRRFDDERVDRVAR
jgi:hypothetical protein